MFTLDTVPMFAALGEKHLKELQNHTYMKQFTKESIVFYEGDSSDYLHILLSGSVKLYKSTPKGNTIEINRLEAPALVGEYACFEQQPFPASCAFVTDGVMGLLPFEMVYKYLGHAEFSLEIIKSLTGKVALLSALVHQETVLSSEAKVADLILRQRSFFHRLKNNEIASILNLTPETFSRIMSKFKKEGIISVNRHLVEVHNEEALYHIVQTNTMKDCTNCIAHFKKQIGYNAS
jgi:CRP/FNR family transcriptional regulator